MRIPLIDVLARTVTTDKANGLDIGVLADGIYSRHGSMHDVENACWKACLLAKFGDYHGSPRIPF